MKVKIPPVVWLLSVVSLLNDIASEMLYPVLPIFITQILGAPVFVVGIIEGIAEGSASLFKTFFGFWSDEIQRRKPFVVGGYSASAVAKIIIALAYAWPLVLVGRIIDRMGKGARTGARDALLLEATDETNKGFIFGFHRAMDTTGAVIGPAIALILLFLFHNNIRLILYLAVIPAFLSLIFFIWVKEARPKLQAAKMKFSLSIQNFPPELKMFLFGLCVFSLGNSSDSFLILRAKNLGLSLVLVISAYILYNIVYALSSTPAGAISDKIGTKKVFITGIIIFALVYLGFAFDKSGIFVWPLFAVYGFYIGLTDGVSKAMVGSLVGEERAGTAYGVLYTITSGFTLLASVIGGFLWSLVAPSATFYFAVICAAISIPIFLLIKPKFLKI
jgi:MFS family permease